jgi:Flp pilus assembly protein TadG
MRRVRIDREAVGERRHVGRARGDSGVAVVEFALTVPIFMMMVMMMITGGLALYHKTVMTNASREAARYGATLPQTQCPCNGLSWTETIQSVAVQQGGGDVSTGDVCVALVQGAGVAVAAVDSSHTTAGGTAACFTDSSGDSSKRVQVKVEKVDQIQWILGSTNVTLQAKSTIKFEQ